MSLENYIKSRAEFVAVDDELDKIMRLLSTISDGLKYRRDSVALTGTATNIPEGDGGYRRRMDTKPADEWPSADRIMERLALWHTRRAKVKADWAAVDKDQQAAMQPPPESATGNPKRY